VLPLFRDGLAALPRGFRRAFPPLAGGFGGALAAFARALPEILTRLLAPRRREQQRHRCAHRGTRHESDEEAAWSHPVVVRHFTLHYDVRSDVPYWTSVERSAAVAYERNEHVAGA
jgi:hypothetical protein